MILELIATGLLAYGVATASVNGSNCYRSVDNNSCYDQTLELSQPNYAANTYSLRGIYNFVDNFDYSDIPDNTEVDYELHVDDDKKFTTPIIYANEFYFVEYLYLTFSKVSPSTPRADVTFYCYDSFDPSDTITLSVLDIYDGDSLGDSSASVYPYRDLYFSLNTTYFLNQNDYLAFTHLFTNDDNAFVTSYSGYYSFINTSTSFTQTINLLGNFTFNNATWFGFSNFNGSSYYSDYIRFYGYYGTDVTYNFELFSYPFKNYAVISQNMLISKSKMSYDTYDYLSRIGVFAYQRDSSYDNTTFHDLLFSIMDSPIYMLSKLLNFELFGVNLFIAFTGLLTLAIMVVVIRKIW